MPMGGGNPKIVGDGQVVVLRPEATRGNSDIWDMKDVIVALIEEREELRAALAGAINYGAFQVAVAALPRWVKIIDSQNDTP
jgi:hypothetical protein